MHQRTLVTAARPAILEPLFFLWWWYTRALMSVLFTGLFVIAVTEDRFSLLQMLKQIVLLQPLHQDYSVIGRVIGVVIRLLWSLVGIVSITVAIGLAFGLIGLWIAVPLMLIAGLVRGWL